MTTKEEAASLRETLAKTHERHHLCGPDTRLVVEGYPRSSNSYAVDMIGEAAIGFVHRSKIGHHTHEVANLQIADAYGIPKVILIRAPEDAILSFHIYSQAPIARCATKYADFYAGAIKLLGKNTAVIHFRDIIGDFSRVIARINAIGDFNIPEDQDYDMIRTRALGLVRGRLAKASAEDAMRQVAAPNEEREEIKKALRADVQTFLNDHPRAQRVYARMMEKAGLEQA